MGSVERTFDRGTRRGHRSLREFGEETHEARIGAGLSQTALGRAVHMSAAKISRLERAQLPRLAIMDASRVAGVPGLDLVVRVYPGGSPLRDAAHAERLRRILSHVRRPLRHRLDVPLPQRPDQPMEQRGWDAMLYGHGRRTGIELEMRLRDAQATIRRHALKRRDDPVEGFLLVLADTRTNRRIYAENADLWPQLPRLRTSRVLATVEAGDHPPSGIVFI
jgi:transcriptional regulator with XRE-family HTH domain